MHYECPEENEPRPGAWTHSLHPNAEFQLCKPLVLQAHNMLITLLVHVGMTCIQGKHFYVCSNVGGGR